MFLELESCSRPQSADIISSASACTRPWPLALRLDRGRPPALWLAGKPRSSTRDSSAACRRAGRSPVAVHPAGRGGRLGIVPALLALRTVLDPHDPCLPWTHDEPAADGGRRRAWTMVTLLCSRPPCSPRPWPSPLPLVLLAIDVYPLRRLRADLDLRRPVAAILGEKLPFLALAIVFVGLAILAKQSNESLISIEHYGVLERFWSSHVTVFVLPGQDLLATRPGGVLSTAPTGGDDDLAVSRQHRRSGDHAGDPHGWSSLAGPGHRVDRLPCDPGTQPGNRPDRQRVRGRSLLLLRLDEPCGRAGVWCGTGASLDRTPSSPGCRARPDVFLANCGIVGPELAPVPDLGDHRWTLAARSRPRIPGRRHRAVLHGAEPVARGRRQGSDGVLRSSAPV